MSEMIYSTTDAWNGETLVGPMPLKEALAAADELGGLRMAVSSPDGDFIALQAHGVVMVRRVNRKSGHAGSVAFTGRWMTAAECPVSSWRPA